MGEQKEPRDDNSVSDHSSPDRTNDVTPEFESNLAHEHADLVMAAETTMSGHDFDDDFERHSTLSEEREMPNVPPRLKQAVT